jgi:hypothetical protein
VTVENLDITRYELQYRFVVPGDYSADRFMRIAA